MTFDEIAALEFSIQEALWLAYEQADEELKEMGWVKPPHCVRLTLEQMRARIAGRAQSRLHFRIPDASFKSFKRRN
ncbi:MAG: hypothetical protein L0Z53_15075 [Acidobacteriales bacterium]|nr:hypothetical protein [Terriglobales bacterium]